MPKRSSKRQKDTQQLARSVLDQIAPDAEPQAEARPKRVKKNPAAVALGRLGGLKGGKARAGEIIMLSMPAHQIPNNAFPRDVTSPGPDQRPGVAKSQHGNQPAFEKAPVAPPVPGKPPKKDDRSPTQDK